MSRIKLKSRAKINLSLDILSKRSDGYHEVKMVMQQIDLYDNISIKTRLDKEIKITTNCEFIPTNSSNIVYKAVKSLNETLSMNKGVDIHIDKRIPISAGLAGGSSNAAAVLQGLNQLWDLKLSQKQLMDIGVTIGADVPFCILGGTALAQGIGEKLTPIEMGMKSMWLILVKPYISISTKEVYGQLDLSKIDNRPKTEEIIKSINEGNIYTLSNKMCNVLETVTEKQYPIITDIKRRIMEHNSLGVLMSGSGPTVFGIYKDYKRAKIAYQNISRFYKQTYIAQTYNGGQVYWMD